MRHRCAPSPRTVNTRPAVHATGRVFLSTQVLVVPLFYTVFAESTTGFQMYRFFVFFLFF